MNNNQGQSVNPIERLQSIVDNPPIDIELARTAIIGAKDYFKTSESLAEDATAMSTVLGKIATSLNGASNVGDGIAKEFSAYADTYGILADSLSAPAAQSNPTRTKGKKQNSKKDKS